MMKVKPVKLGKTERMSFSHIDEVISMPNLIEVQKNSYQWFLDEGLKEVFKDISSIGDYTGNLVLEEGNGWHDTFWGVDLKTGEGENHLGRILMQVREELREER